jgi:hypothetical protein
MKALKRTSLKLSIDLSNEEVRKAISDFIGVPLNSIPDVDFKSEIEKIKEHKRAVDTIINNYKARFKDSPQFSVDKLDELVDLSRFILASGNKFSIQIPNTILEFPDFIITDDGKNKRLIYNTIMYPFS